MQAICTLGAMSVVWYLSQAATTLSLLFLWYSAYFGRRFILLGSIVMAVVATYSVGNGMVIWPVLLVMAALLRLPRRCIIGIAAAGVVSIAVYFVIIGSLNGVIRC
jgi:hypothetical protein